MQPTEQIVTTYIECLGRNLEMASAVLRAACRIRQHQCDALCEASQQCQTLQQGLGHSDAADGGMAVISDLWRMQAERTLSLWSDAGQEWMAVQSELGSHFQRYSAEFADTLCKQAEMVQLGLPLDTSYLLSPALEPVTSFMFPRVEPASADDGRHRAH